MRVLLIEDEASLARSTARLIKRAFPSIEITVDLADSPTGAITLLEVNTYDFIVSDFSVNGGTGGDVLIWIERKCKHMVERFVFFSGANHLDLWHDKVISKGVDPQEFIDRLRSHLPMVPL